MAEPFSVVRRAVAVYQAFENAGIASDLGGALALAYHVDEPRATRDIDVNVVLPKDRALEALEALPVGVPWDAAVLSRIHRDGQARIMWPVAGAVPLPLDLFFAEDILHQVAHGRAVTVDMAGTRVRILSATDLTIFKALFDRPKDWIDIDSMLTASDSTVDLLEAARQVGRIVGADDPRTRRLSALAR